MRIDPVEVKAVNGYPVHNLDTGLNYTTIQEAIDANETLDGHTIFVEEGTYYENVVVNKSVILTGENRNTTIIDGNEIGTVVEIDVDNITLRDFTIRNGRIDLGKGGIVVDGVMNTVIEDCVIRDTFVGIYFFNSGNNSLQNNIITNSTEGIRLFNAENNSLIGNMVASGRWGVNLIDSGNNTLQNNEINDNVYNFGVWAKTLHHFMNDIDASNTINGKTIHYLTNKRSLNINPNTFPNLGYLALINSSQIEVENFKVADNIQGVLLAYTDNSALTNMSVTNNWHGIFLHASTHNTLSANKIIGNDGGIEISSSSYNKIIENILANNLGGISSINSHNNTFKANTLVNSIRGIYVAGTYTSSNIFFHNNFINNSIHVEVAGTNYWNDNIEGNYWDNYNGSDSDHDGIGDSWLVIDQDNVDHYPLMGMFYSFNVSLHPYPSGGSEYVNVVSNSTVENLNLCINLGISGYPPIFLQFYVNGEDGTGGFCRVMIPRTVLNFSSYNVVVNFKPIDVTELQVSNSTHAYIYFTYQHIKQVQVIEIIPEFPSFLIIPLFLIATLLIMTNHKRNPT